MATKKKRAKKAKKTDGETVVEMTHEDFRELREQMLALEADGLITSDSNFVSIHTDRDTKLFTPGASTFAERRDIRRGMR